MSKRAPGRVPLNVPARRASVAVALCFALLPAPSLAQQADFLPKLHQMSVSTRAMALGDAYAMDSGHADAVFAHPALLANASGMGLEVQRWGPESSAVALSAAFGWLDGGVGVGLRTLQYSVAAEANPLVPGGQDHLFGSGGLAISERVATLGFARETWLGLDLGVGVDLVDLRVGDERESLVQVDVGLAREVGPLTFGITVADLGEKPESGSGDRPSSVSLGAGAYGRPVWIFDLGVAATVGLEDDEVVYGGGIEIGYWPIVGRTFVARLGFQDVPEGSDALPVTTGLAVWLDEISIEWAFRPFSGADEGGTHRFGLRWQ